MKKDNPVTTKPYLVRVLSHVLRLPNYVSVFESKFAAAESDSRELSVELHKVEKLNSLLTKKIIKLEEKLETVDSMDDKLSDMKKFLTLSQIGTPQTTNAPRTTVNSTVADNHHYDSFYKKFEDKFRGSESLIKERVIEHLSLFQSLPNNIKKKRVVDIGCGRGEFLSIMKENNFDAIGVDMNGDMVERANKLGYSAVQNDALSFLTKQDSGSLAAVTGFHIVEHIPFEPLMDIFAECYRTLARGGFVLFETPNPHSLTVGANTFYTDPSHLKPVPPELLSFMLEYTGFKSEIVPLHRLAPEINTSSEALRNVFESVYGFADYAVIATKS